MPTNNILLFDQNKGNMMGDEAYSTNTQRLNGVQTGIASSQLQNKFQYQVSLVAYAIASLMYNNGLDANDANAVSAFVSNLSGTLVQKVLDKANTQEAQLGTVDTKWMSPALVKAAIDYCHANAVTFGSNVTVGGNLLVSGTSSMNGAATFASTSTFTGAATFNGVAQGQSPTANSHFATKGYVDTQNNELLSMINPVLLYEDSFTITGNTSRTNNSNINIGYKMLILEYDLSNITISVTSSSSAVTFYFVNNDVSTLQFYGDTWASSYYKKKYTCMLYARAISTDNYSSTNPIVISYCQAGITVSSAIRANFDYVMTANSSNVFYCTVNSANISGSMIYRIYGLYAI